MPQPYPLVHIGFYKAASTWLQKCYFQEQFGYRRLMDSLRLQVNFLDPQPPAFDPDASRAKLAAQTAPVQQEGLCPVISSEALCGDLVRGGHNQQSNARRLREIVGEDVRILLVVREQRQLLRSAYKTLVYFGESRSLARLLTPLAEGEHPRFHPQFLCFDQLVELYQQLFSPQAVLVLPYELFREQPLAFLRQIREHAGLPPLDEARLAELPLQKKLNANEGLGFIEAQRLGNLLAGNASHDYQGRGERNDFARVIRRIAWHKRHNRPLPVDDWLERRFARRLAGLTPDMFSASNRRLEALTGLELSPYGYQ